MCPRKAGNLSAPSPQLLHVPHLLTGQLQDWRTKLSHQFGSEAAGCHQPVVGQTALANWLLQGQKHQLLRGLMILPCHVKRGETQIIYCIARTKS